MQRQALRNQHRLRTVLGAHLFEDGSHVRLHRRFGYLQLHDYQKAKHYGEIGLALAEEPRQVRNAHYLLGEAAYEAGDLETAEGHFDELTKFYPEFRNLKKLLFALDLRSMVNLRL